VAIHSAGYSRSTNGQLTQTLAFCKVCGRVSFPQMPSHQIAVIVTFETRKTIALAKAFHLRIVFLQV